MQAVALGKKSCLEFHENPFWESLLFKIFMCDLIIILEEIDFASYADDNTPFVSEATPENVVSSAKLFC